MTSGKALLYTLAVALGIVLGTAAHRLHPRAAAAPEAQPALGCCYTRQGTVEGITRLECVTSYDWIGWAAGDCPCVPLGCCWLPGGGVFSHTTFAECYDLYGGEQWIVGDCP